ncbi:MAG TPA: alkaline phosphatase family protein [Solirubrobacteraceae bacterium]|nr:alkaline phosphatase family protein [Solirubrobacteraceae bacterium]
MPGLDPLTTPLERRPGEPAGGDRRGQTRRGFIAHGAGALAGATLGGPLLLGGAPALGAPRARRPSVSDALQVLGRTSLRHPESLPAPALPAGVDTMPQIEHVVVLMLENHSYDNFLGMLGRDRGQRPRGDGFTLARDGLPTAACPYPDGRLQRAFRMPTTCQLPGQPSQEWTACHVAFDGGANDGFVRAPVSPTTSEICGPVAMGYWTAADLPFTHGLASSFPIGDRWFSSCLAQTDPNRRFLIAATSSGMTGDVGGNPEGDAGLGVPANGTIFNRFTAAGVTWADYAANNTTGATLNLYPGNDGAYLTTNVKPLAQFFTDARAGTLPSFSLIDPDYGTQSQENPQNIVAGEALLAQVVDAVGQSPAWRRTMLIVTYDEHGGYYDHVPPPAAIAPDAIGPQVLPGESTYDGFARYGFRVPAVVVSPYAKTDYVSHVVYDHTSILAFVERKWNLPALTYRDANANDLTDFLNLPGMAAGNPTFPELPMLPGPGENPQTLACAKSGPGQIPPALPPPPPAPRATPIRVQLRDLGVRRHRHGLLLELRTSHGALTGLEVELHHGARRVTRAALHRLTTHEHPLVLRVRARAPKPGRYTLIVRHGRRVLLRRAIRIRSRG